MKRKLKQLALTSASVVLIISAQVYGSPENSLAQCKAQVEAKFQDCSAKFSGDFSKECKAPIPNWPFLGLITFDFSSQIKVCIVAKEALAKANIASICEGTKADSLHRCEDHYELDKKAQERVQTLDSNLF